MEPGGDGNPLIFTLDKTDIWEYRHWQPPADKYKWSWVRPLLLERREMEVDRTLTRPGHAKRGERPLKFPPPVYPTRLPVGRAELHPAGRIQNFSMRLNLHTATAPSTTTPTSARVALTGRALAGR